MKKRPTYLRSILEGLQTAFKGMRLTGKHLLKGYDRELPLGISEEGYFKKETGPITIQYPKEKVPIPDTGRYRLQMETDDCIGCDKCARICPVDCITIETFRADGDLGKTSDGTVKRLHLPTFDIDMAKCMYCGLCTTVCPTECLTMTPVYDYSEYDRDSLIYHFGAYSPSEEVRLREETEAALAAKKVAKAVPNSESTSPAKRRPILSTNKEDTEAEKKSYTPRPRPLIKKESLETAEEVGNTEENLETTLAPKKRPRPIIKRQLPEDDTTPQSESNSEDEASAPKKRPRPIMKREVAEDDITPQSESNSEDEASAPKKRPRPIMKRESADDQTTPQSESNSEDEASAPKKRPRPIMKRESADDQTTPQSESNSEDEAPAPKKRPRPIMKRPENSEEEES